MKTGIIIQARLTSQRFPNKILEPIGDSTVIGMVIDAACRADIGQVYLAMPIGQGIPAAAVSALPSAVYCGSEHDVGSRFYHCAKKYNLDLIIRLTGDCPLVDPQTIIQVRDECLRNKGYAGRCDVPDGDDAEAFTFAELEAAFMAGPSEHVTTLMRERYIIPNPVSLRDVRYSVNTHEDLEMVRALVKTCGPQAGRTAYINACRDMQTQINRA